MSKTTQVVYVNVTLTMTTQEMGFVTPMCDVVGNDCGALKTAHIGMTLSDTKVSIVSPFTSLDKTITSVVEILKEGRCVLAFILFL